MIQFIYGFVVLIVLILSFLFRAVCTCACQGRAEYNGSSSASKRKSTPSEIERIISRGSNVEQISAKPFITAIIPKLYKEYLTRMLPQYIYPRGQNGFNMALLLDSQNSRLIVTVRFLNVPCAITGECEVVPGNYSETGLKSIMRSIGKNFIWGRWTETLVDTTIFFAATLREGELVPDESVAPQYIHTQQVKLNEPPAGVAFQIGDIRMFSSLGKSLADSHNYIYDGFVSFIKDFDIIENPRPPMEKLTYSNFNICNNPAKYFKKYDKNWAFLRETSIGAKDYFTFLHWYGKGASDPDDGVYVVHVDKAPNAGCTLERIIEFHGDPVPKLGNAHMGMFSFGVPFCSIPGDATRFASVGHTKILRTQTYEGQINQFRNHVNFDYEHKYGDRYIEHHSYIYAMYFILLEIGENKESPYTMKISNCYLPLDESAQYIFSLVFPMSIHARDGKLWISAGIGDWYNIIMSVDLAVFVKKCKHDVSEFDAKKYKYKIVKV